MPKRPLSSIALPSGMLAALTRLGYDTVQDVMDVRVGILSKEMNIPLGTAENLLSSIQRYSKLHTIGSSQPPTQAVSSLVGLPQKIPINYSPMDRLLDGGVSRGQLLEIAGPPGCPKEALLLKVVLAFVELGQEVIFLETQNMVSPATIHKTLRHLPPDRLRLVRFLRILSLPDFMIFIHGLTPLLEAQPATGLLVVNSISYLFQSNATMTASTKNMLLSQVKDAFTRACILRQLTIATTSQMATKMLKPDGSPGAFDDGGRGVMQPALGDSNPSCFTVADDYGRKFICSIRQVGQGSRDSRGAYKRDVETNCNKHQRAAIQMDTLRYESSGIVDTQHTVLRNGVPRAPEELRRDGRDKQWNKLIRASRFAEMENRAPDPS